MNNLYDFTVEKFKALGIDIPRTTVKKFFVLIEYDDVAQVRGFLHLPEIVAEVLLDIQRQYLEEVGNVTDQT